LIIVFQVFDLIRELVFITKFQTVLISITFNAFLLNRKASILEIYIS